MLASTRKGALLIVALAATFAGCERKSSAPALLPHAEPAALPPIDPASAATLVVRVKLNGPPPANPPADVSIDRCCATAHPQGLTNERVLVNPDGTLRNVYVHVKSGLGKFGFPHVAGHVMTSKRAASSARASSPCAPAMRST